MSDPHWTPQRCFLPQGFRPLDEIGKVESLDEDLRRIFSRLYPEVFQLTDYGPHATGAGKVEVALSGRSASPHSTTTISRPSPTSAERLTSRSRGR